jgi:hypothetical protein
MRGAMRIALVTVTLVGALSTACGAQNSFEPCGSGPCPSTPHHWTAQEVARDVASLTFPAATDPRDHLYQITCHINAPNTRAACSGRGKIGSHAGKQVSVRMLLRVNGTLDDLCWPNPSALCAPSQIRDQRAHPVTD